MKPDRRSLYLDLQPSQIPRTVAYHAARWGLLVALAVLTYALYPVAGGFEVPLPEAGEVAAEEVLAPFDFVVRKSSAEIEREAATLSATVPPVYDFDERTRDSVLARTDRLFAALDSAENANEIILAAQRFGVRLNPDESTYVLANRRLSRFRTAVRTVLRRELGRGVAGPGTVESQQHGSILIRRGDRERVVPRDSVVTYQQFLDGIGTNHPDPNSAIGNGLYVKLLVGLFHPTLVPNTAVTEELRRDLRASVDSVRDRVRANERIVDANEVVTPEIRARLVALRAEQLRRGGGSEGNVMGVVGQVLTNALVLAAFWLLLMLYRGYTYDNLRHMLVFSLLLGLVVVGAALNRRFISEVPELIPIPFAAMLITILFSGRVAIVAALVLAILIGTQAVYGGADALFVAFVGGVAAALSVRVIRRRTQLLVSVAIVTGAFMLADVVVGLRAGVAITEVGLSGLAGGMNALLSAALVLIALPIFEHVARVTTDFTLLELSDPSRPLLRRLATEAPGTYAHSISMANLCEAACNAIGADGLLARVGCYYHDVGKLKKPQFFVENQSAGRNPHDKLKPDVSAAIIRNHVREGLALCDEHKLPPGIKAFIPEHHGTMEITYFLEKARQRTSDPDVKPEEYQYPGPRPQSIETAVTMLADGVEAAVRVLDDPNPQKVRNAIDHIVDKRIAAGQLDEAPITFGQVNQVKEEFSRVLGGVYHNRIDYPSSVGGISADWQPASTA